MKNMNNYDKKIEKYNVGTFNINSYSSNPIISYRDINYCISSEDEKANSRSNNNLSDKNKNINGKSKSKYETKLLNHNAHYFPSSQKFLNEFNKNNNIFLDNTSNLSNHTFISLNSLEKNPKILAYNKYKNNDNSIKHEIEKRINKNNFYQEFIQYSNNSINQKINCQSNSITKDKSNNKYIDNYNKAEYNSNTITHCRPKINCIKEENEFNYNSKTNSSRHKDSFTNYEKIERINFKNNYNISYNNYIKNNSIEKNTKRINININNANNKQNNINNILNLNKKNIINKIPNTRINNDKKNFNSTLKSPEFIKLQKLTKKNNTNLPYLNDSSLKNNTDKNNHSFFEVKSLSRDFHNKQTEIIFESKAKIEKHKNNHSIINLSSSKKSNESNLKQSNNNNINKINNNNKKEDINKAKNNLFKVEDRKESKEDIKERRLKIIDMNEYKRRTLPKENQKRYSEIITKTIISNISNNDIKTSKNNSIFNKTNPNYNCIEKKGYNIKKFGNVKIIIDNNHKMKEIRNKRKINYINPIKKIHKYKFSKTNSYSFNYCPSSLKEDNKNKKNKKKKKAFNCKEKLMTLRNLNNKTFEEDFPLKKKSYQRYKYNKYLKPQIAFRITLFNVIKPEKKRYYFVNFFYSENIKNPILIESDF
jgi:hypothetical protein